MKISDDLEKLLPFGYLFLILMGMLKDSIYYYQLGINILKFSTITDILISPIVYITSHPIILITIFLLFASHLYLPKFLSKNKDKKSIQKTFDLKPDEELTIEERKSYYNQIAIKTLAVILLSFFMGTGLASGYITSQRITKGALDYNYKLNFNDEKPQEVNLLGTNSLYCFYVEKGQRHIKIAPIGSIKNIELLYATSSK
ncbi:hypothetical protein [Flavobacterium panacagri]|uniref:hypothetical protein n=1 Tax=Flavobacterium panacagri TaxID=3034146 RepID=UPI0025A5C3C0|nr:hypothetical protein [Flavobacterium panacagri]